MKLRYSIALALTVAVLLTLLSGCGEKTDPAALIQFEAPKVGSEVAVVTTSQGTMKFMLFSDEAPHAVEQFKTLAQAGFWDGAWIDRLLNDFFFEIASSKATALTPVTDEYSMKLWHFTGALGFAKDDNSNTSHELYVVTATAVPADTLALMRDIEEDSRGRFPEAVLEQYEQTGGFPQLDGRYAIFGQLYEGFDVLSKIDGLETQINENTNEQSDMTVPVTITSITFETIEKQ